MWLFFHGLTLPAILYKGMGWLLHQYALWNVTTEPCPDLRQAIFIVTSSNGNIFRVTGPLCGEFTGPGEFPTQMPVTRSFDVFFDLCLNKRLGKQPWSWWFETPSWSLWRHCNVSGRDPRCISTLFYQSYRHIGFLRDLEPHHSIFNGVQEWTSTLPAVLGPCFPITV